MTTKNPAYVPLHPATPAIAGVADGRAGARGAGSRRLAAILLDATLIVSILSHTDRMARAAELEGMDEIKATKASRLYQHGRYKRAAKLFAELTVAFPDMPFFERNLGACFYYLKKPDPALYHLRNYLKRHSAVSPDDKAVVDRWIEEMEELRAPTQAAIEPSPAAVPLYSPASTAEAEPASRGALTLTERAAASEPPPSPIYKRWWFWGTVAAVVGVGAITAVALTTSGGDSSNIPGTTLGNQGVFQ